MSDRRYRIVEEVFQDVRAGNTRSAVNGCLRLARASSDPFGTAYFLFEQEITNNEAIRQLMTDFPAFDRKQIEAIIEIENNRYNRNRSMEEFEAESLGLGENRVLPIGASSFDNQIDKQVRAMEIQSIPEGMTPDDTAFFHQEAIAAKAKHIQMKSAIERLKERCLSKCFNYASMIEKQLDASNLNDSALRAIENEVFSFLRATSTEAFDQLTGAAKQLRIADDEARSGGLLGVRRCLKSVADVVQPAVPNNPSLGNDKFLNRLAYYIEENPRQKGTKGLDHKALEALLRDLNDRASKAVHSKISGFEAEQVLLGTFLFLHRVSHGTPPQQ